eukprot:26529-Chlamydomonas_euryale.AAC.2
MMCWGFKDGDSKIGDSLGEHRESTGRAPGEYWESTGRALGEHSILSNRNSDLCMCQCVIPCAFM